MNTENAAAHLVAKHLREIARLLPLLSTPDLQDAYLPGLSADPTLVAPVAQHLLDKAAKLEATAPFEPVSDADKAEMRAAMYEECADLNGRETAELVYGDWTEAEWRMDKDDRDEMEREDDAFIVGGSDD